MVVVSILPRAESEQNDHLENAPHFIMCPNLKKFLNASGRIKQLKEYSMPITPHAIWNFVEQSDFCWVMLFYTTENKTMIEFNQHERLKITFRNFNAFQSK